ncbi:hypothetical protein Tco_0904533 [Tanacetum coccineum]
MGYSDRAKNSFALTRTLPSMNQKCIEETLCLKLDLKATEDISALESYRLVMFGKVLRVYNRYVLLEGKIFQSFKIRGIMLKNKAYYSSLPRKAWVVGKLEGRECIVQRGTHRFEKYDDTLDSPLSCTATEMFSSEDLVDLGEIRSSGGLIDFDVIVSYFTICVNRSLLQYLLCSSQEKRNCWFGGRKLKTLPSGEYRAGYRLLNMDK